MSVCGVAVDIRRGGVLMKMFARGIGICVYAHHFCFTFKKNVLKSVRVKCIWCGRAYAGGV